MGNTANIIKLSRIITKTAQTDIIYCMVCQEFLLISH